MQLLCASCCVQMLCAFFSAQVALCKCFQSCRNVLRVQPLYLKVAILQPELRRCTPRTTFVLKCCDLAAGAAGVYSAYYVCTYKFRFLSRSCGSALRAYIRLYLKVAIWQPELQECIPRTTFVLKSYDFPAGAAGVHSAHIYVCI